MSTTVLPLRLSALSLALWSGLAGAVTLNDDPARWLLCGPRVGFDWEQPVRPAGPGDSELSADRFDVSGKDVYRLEGAVQVDRPGQRLGADRIDYTHSTSEYRAEGHVRFQSAELALAAARAEGQLSAERTELQQVEYQLLSARGNGRAEQASVSGQQADLRELSYTTCNPGSTGWRMDAAQLQLDQATGVGTARNATLRVGELPVLWLPYATFPIDERRRSGFLYPSVGSAGDTGIDVRAPYYLNLAPNYDATLTPRLLGRRGMMLGSEFRYLGNAHGGKLEANWLPDDDLTGRDRGSLRFRHSGVFNPQWRVDADLNHVSDDRYFEDFGDSLTARSTSLLGSFAALSGRGEGWRGSLAVRSWDVTDPFVPDSAEPYRQLPRMRLALDRPLGAFRAGFDGEAVAFDHTDGGLGSFYYRGDAQRYDLTPWLELPFERAAGYVRPRLAWRHTGYRLSDDWLRDLGECQLFDCEFAPPPVYPDRSPSRSTAIASIDAALNFERSTTLFGEAMLQTLQPRLYYLHVPYEDQSDIPLFDTQELTFGFDQLFRPNRYTGADRQMDANQATLAVTSRWFAADSGQERLALSLGQIRYFEDQRVQLPGVPTQQRSGSAWVAGADLALSPSWNLGVSQQWDPEIDHSTVSGVRAGWRSSGGALANFAYRYRRAELEQVDGSFAIPLGEAWRWVGRWNYSLRDRSTLESFGGFEWQSCCVAFRVLGRHYVRNREGEKNNALYFELELKGLGSFGRDTAEFLQRAILGYSR